MTNATDTIPGNLNSRLAWLLGLGSWASCILIACGMALPMFGMSSPSISGKIVTAGIVILIALPTIRVATMSVWFLLNRNLDFAIIAGAVLAIIIASTLFGAGAA